APDPSSKTRRTVAAAAVAFATLLVAWAVWQPESSARATERASELAAEGRYDDALAEVDDAADADPLSTAPLLERAEIELAAGSQADARRTLERAVLSFPGDPHTWLRLTRFQLYTLERPGQALGTVRGALYLDPYSREARQLFLDSRITLRRAR
ncbi:MAG TPA: tetratricopeptide repeat protein, partial [Thermoleophilaceae bacterium]|nr:tetratricopeptide repeat protein [Thermoleophilaceae bacterium]